MYCYRLNFNLFYSNSQDVILRSLLNCANLNKNKFRCGTAFEIETRFLHHSSLIHLTGFYTRPNEATDKLKRYSLTLDIEIYFFLLLCAVNQLHNISVFWKETQPTFQQRRLLLLILKGYQIIDTHMHVVICPQQLIIEFH